MDALYCSVRDIRNELKADEGSIPAPDDPAIDSRMLGYIRQASLRIHRLSGRQFAPSISEKAYGAGWVYDSSTGVIYLPEPAMSLIGVTGSDGTPLVQDIDYMVYPTHGVGIEALTLAVAGGSSGICGAWLTPCGACPGGVSGPAVNAVWGIHDDYAGAWISTGAVLDGAIDDTVTTFDVSTVDTPDEWGLAPCLSAGMIIQIGTEWMLIRTVIDMPTLTITVKRGINGTLAAAHADAAPIDSFQVMSDINQATARFAAFPYKRRGDYVQTSFDGVATQTLPADLPPDVRGALHPYL